MLSSFTILLYSYGATLDDDKGVPCFMKFIIIIPTMQALEEPFAQTTMVEQYKAKVCFVQGLVTNHERQNEPPNMMDKHRATESQANPRVNLNQIVEVRPQMRR